MLEAHSMSTNGLVRFIVVVIVLFLFISVGEYLLFRPSTTTPPSAADINAIYQVVGEFGARLKDVVITTSDQDVITAVDFNLKQLITDRLYQVFVQDKIRIPGRYVSSPWPERIEIASVQMLDSGFYTVNGSQIVMTDDTLAHGGNAGETPITLTLKKVKGTWLIDDVTGGPKA
jgi:orotate phosphoribosyltransferase-like protein